MNWEAVAAGSELLGSLAILVTLVYLAIQTRHARAANEATVQWQRANASRELAMMWATHPDAVDLLAEYGQLDSGPPADGEFDPRFFRYCKINQAILETLHAIYMTAETSEDKQLAIERIRTTGTMPGFRVTWPRIKSLSLFREEFIAIVEECISGRSDA